MKAVVAAFNQEKALVGAFSVIMNLRMEIFEALQAVRAGQRGPGLGSGGQRRHGGRGRTITGINCDINIYSEYILHMKRNICA